LKFSIGKYEFWKKAGKMLKNAGKKPGQINITKLIPVEHYEA